MQGELFLLVLGAALAVVLSRRFYPRSANISRGAQAVHRILKASLPRSEYTILRDVRLRTETGVKRIDLVVVSRFGVFVIGIQERPGWITGDERNSHWTQLTDNTRVEFSNPLHENRARIEALQALLGLHSSRFHSLVVFAGKAEFMKSLPANVMRTDRLLPCIEFTGTECLEAETVQRIVETIESSRLDPAAVSESPPGRPESKAGGVRTARPRLSQGFARRLSAKALAGIGAIAVLLVAGNALMRDLTQLTATDGGPLPAFPEPRAPEDLQCAYASDTDRCACYEADGARVRLGFEECKVRAEEAADHSGT